MDYRDDYCGITQPLHPHARIVPQNKTRPFLELPFHYSCHSHPIIWHNIIQMTALLNKLQNS